MEDSSVTPSESTETQLSESNSLEAPVAEQSVADLSGSQKNYPLETLEVQQEGVKGTESKVEYVPTVRSVPFSKRKAILISIGITLVVVAVTAVSLGYLVRENAMDKDSIERNVPTQGVEIDSLSEDLYTKEFSDSQPSLLVDGDIITKGALKVSVGDFMTVFRGQSATADQVISLPALSGELCLSTNNCDFANLADLTAVQNSIVAPTTLNSQDGEVTIQGTSNRINVSTTGSVITITTPQALNTAANVQFSRLSLSSGLVVNAIDSAAGDLVISAANNYVRFVDGDRTFRFPSNGLANQTICTTQNNCNYGTGNGDIVNGGQIGPIIIGTNDASSLSFYTNALNRLNIATNGNIAMNTDTLFVDAVNNRVGIGTSSPVGMLDIVNPTTGQRLVKFTSNSNGYLGAAIVLESSNVARGRGLFLTTTDQASNAWFVGNGYASTDFMIGASSSHSLSGLNGAYRDINSALIIKNATKLIGINTVNPSGQLHVISGSAARQALIVQGAASQTANLQEWQSNTGTILASVSAAGVGSFANLLQNGNQVCDATNNCNYAPSTGGNGYIQNQTAIPQTAGFNITGNGTIGGNLTVDTNTLTVDSTNNRVGIGTAAPSTTLDVSGNVNVSSRLQVGAAEGINECPTIIGPAICDFGIKNINSSSEVLNASYGIFNSLIMTGSSNNAPDNYASLNSISVGGSTTFLGNQIGVNGTAAYSGSGTLGGLIGVMGQAGATDLSNGSISMIAGLQGVVGGGASTIGSAYGLSILSATLSGGTITNNYGIQVQAQSVGVNNYGVAIGEASTQTLWLQGDGGTANTGIGFGSTRDTNIYRSETGVLKTDGKLIIGDNNQPLFFGGYYGGGSIETPSFVVNATTSSLDYTAGSYTQLNLNPSSASAGGVGGVISITSDSASIGDINELVGGIIGAGHFGSGVAHQAIGQQTGLINGGTGVIDDATGLYVAVQNASTGSITSSSGLHISAVDATSDAYGIRINDVTSATNSYGIAVGEASTQTLWLQGDGGTANTGIGFGSARDTNLYRSAAGVLKTDNRLEVVDRGTFGNNITALEGSFTASLVANRTVNTPSVSEASSISQINFNPTTSPGLVGGYAHISTAATVQTSTESVSVTAGSLSRFVHKGSGGVGVAAGLDARVMLQGTGNISQAAGIRASVQDTGAGSVNLGIGLAVGSVQAASDAYGVLISPLSSATNNYGIAVGEASTQTLWLQGDGGTANTGIGFGSARDTNLYRSAAGVLRTDGNLIVGSEMLVVGAVNLGAELTVAGDVTLGGNLEVVNATVNGLLTVNGNLALNGHVISGNTSGSTTAVSGLASDCSSTATVNINGNDTAGTVEIITGTGTCAAGELAQISFANNYSAAPRVILTPRNAAGASLQYYNGSAATTGFSLNSATAPIAETTYTYNYQVIQ